MQVIEDVTHRRQILDLARYRSRYTGRSRSSMPLKLDYQIIGVIGEYAFAWTFGYKMARRKKRGDGGFDFILPCGEKVDIKATSKAFLPLLVKTKQPGYADIFVDVHAEYDRLPGVDCGYMAFEFRGWIDGYHLALAPQVGPPKWKAENYELQREDLWNIRGLVEKANRRTDGPRGLSLQ